MPETAEILEAHVAHLVTGAPLPAAISASVPELEPMLRIARQLRKIGGIQPSPAAIQRTRMALLRACDDQARGGVAWRPRLWRRPVMALAFAVLLITLGTTSVLAAPAALPDSPLYGVRNLREAVEVKLAGTPARRAALYASFAEERAAQLRRLVQTKNASPEIASWLLRDIAARVHEAKQQARDDGPGARSAVRQVEGDINSQLGEVQQMGGFSANVNEQLGRTIQDVESDQSTNAAGAGNDNQP